MPPPLTITGFNAEDEEDDEDSVDNTAEAMFLRAALGVDNVADALRNVVDPINILIDQVFSSLTPDVSSACSIITRVPMGSCTTTVVGVLLVVATVLCICFAVNVLPVVVVVVVVVCLFVVVFFETDQLPFSLMNSLPHYHFRNLLSRITSSIKKVQDIKEINSPFDLEIL